MARNDINWNPLEQTSFANSNALMAQGAQTLLGGFDSAVKLVSDAEKAVKAENQAILDNLINSMSVNDLNSVEGREAIQRSADYLASATGGAVDYNALNKKVDERTGILHDRAIKEYDSLVADVTWDKVNRDNFSNVQAGIFLNAGYNSDTVSKAPEFNQIPAKDQYYVQLAMKNHEGALQKLKAEATQNEANMYKHNVDMFGTLAGTTAENIRKANAILNNPNASEAERQNAQAIVSSLTPVADALRNRMGTYAYGNNHINHINEQAKEYVKALVTDAELHRTKAQTDKTQVDTAMTLMYPNGTSGGGGNGGSGNSGSSGSNQDNPNTVSHKLGDDPNATVAETKDTKSVTAYLNRYALNTTDPVKLSTSFGNYITTMANNTYAFNRAVNLAKWESTDEGKSVRKSIETMYGDGNWLADGKYVNTIESLAALDGITDYDKVLVLKALASGDKEVSSAIGTFTDTPFIGTNHTALKDAITKLRNKDEDRIVNNIRNDIGKVLDMLSSTHGVKDKGALVKMLREQNPDIYSRLARYFPKEFEDIVLNIGYKPKPSSNKK